MIDLFPLNQLMSFIEFKIETVAQLFYLSKKGN